MFLNWLNLYFKITGQFNYPIWKSAQSFLFHDPPEVTQLSHTFTWRQGNETQIEIEVFVWNPAVGDSAGIRDIDYAAKALRLTVTPNWDGRIQYRPMHTR